ncbi:MAG TPA: DUF5060 domain-containing protein, partial [Arachidicoccus soli]|nr:DUF5060 domain-containing protein [Arachidicoccus soli]
MKTIILIIGLGIALSSKAQVNVYSCAVSNHQLTQQELDQQNDFFSTCYTLGGNASVLVNNTATKTIRASESIHLKKGVHLGGFTGGGKTHLYLDKDSSDFAVVVMNYTTLKNVWKYKKLELGITPPQAMQERINHFLFQEGQFADQLNPFLSWDVNVEAHFTHLNGGEEVTVPGFFTREYKEDSATSDWLDIGTDYPFRIRFAPPKTGQWNCTITIALNKQATYQSLPFSFNVNVVGAHGYVKVASNHKNLMLDNRMIFPIGQNFPTDAIGAIYGDECFDADSVHVYPCSWDSDANTWVKDMTKPPIYYGHKLLAKNNTEKAVNTVYWKKFLLEISAYLNTADPGGRKYLRIIQTPAASMIEFEDKGNYYKRLHYAWEMDKLMD